jgi:hypothetical protein
MANRSKFAVAVLVVALTTGIVAPPAFALPREGRERDNPIVRVIKLLLHKFGVGSNSDELAVPKP